MHQISKIPLSALNPLFTCRLCNGYLVDAVTIVECLHSFCRSCIVGYLNVHITCPVCDTLLHKTRPHYAIRPDRVLQSIVYKLIPKLFQKEMAARKRFYANHPDPSIRSLSPEKRGELTLNTFTSQADEPISLELNYWQPDDSELLDNTVPEPNLSESNRSTYLLCPPDLTVAHLEKLIRIKFELAPNEHKVVLFITTDDLFDNDYTLSDLAFLYAWRRLGPMKLFFTIIKSQNPSTSTSHENTTDLNHSNQHSDSNSSSTPSSSTSSPNDNGKHTENPVSDSSNTNPILQLDSEHPSIRSANVLPTNVEIDCMEKDRFGELEPTNCSASLLSSTVPKLPPAPLIRLKTNSFCSPKAY